MKHNETYLYSPARLCVLVRAYDEGPCASFNWSGLGGHRATWNQSAPLRNLGRNVLQVWTACVVRRHQDMSKQSFACNCARMACVRHNVFKMFQDMHGGKSWEMHLVYKFGSSPEQTLLTSHCQGSGKLRDLA